MKKAESSVTVVKKKVEQPIPKIRKSVELPEKKVEVEQKPKQDKN